MTSRAMWYIPNHIVAWQEASGEGVSAITELIVTNHPEAVDQSESVDFELLSTLFAEVAEGVAEEVAETAETHNIMADVMAAISSPSNSEAVIGGESSDLIDKFLGLKDLRIMAEGDSEPCDSAPEGWQQVEISDIHNFEDDASSEELAAIYLSQGLFSEAKEIYTRLFLLYSEKSAYFAGQIENIENREINN